MPPCLSLAWRFRARLEVGTQAYWKVKKQRMATELVTPTTWCPAWYTRLRQQKRKDWFKLRVIHMGGLVLTQKRNFQRFLWRRRIYHWSSYLWRASPRFDVYPTTPLPRRKHIRLTSCNWRLQCSQIQFTWSGTSTYLMSASPAWCKDIKIRGVQVGNCYAPR